VDDDAFAFKKADRVQAGFRGKLVDQAGGEQVRVGRLGRIAPKVLGFRLRSDLPAPRAAPECT